MKIVPRVCLSGRNFACIKIAHMHKSHQHYDLRSITYTHTYTLYLFSCAQIFFFHGVITKSAQRTSLGRASSRHKSGTMWRLAPLDFFPKKNPSALCIVEDFEFDPSKGPPSLWICLGFLCWGCNTKSHNIHKKKYWIKSKNHDYYFRLVNLFHYIY